MMHLRMPSSLLYKPGLFSADFAINPLVFQKLGHIPPKLALPFKKVKNSAILRCLKSDFKIWLPKSFYFNY
jgi:hypothetical protein